jgi:RNA polymerase sigma-70 factor (ECF subfamily)
MILREKNEHFEKAALISGMLRNDQHSFSCLYDVYAASLLGLLMKWAKEKEKAEMLLHQTFIKAWHNRKLFEAEKEDFFNWLCKLARNCYNEYSVT